MKETHIVEYQPYALRNGSSVLTTSASIGGLDVADFSKRLLEPRLWSIVVMTFDHLELDQGGSGGLIVSVTFVKEDASTYDFDGILESFEAFLYGRFSVTVDRFYREIHDHPAHV